MLRLSVEELALLFTHHGHASEGQDIMRATFENIGDDEIRLRLLAAGHALLARELMRMEKDGHFIFPDQVEKVVQSLAGAEYSIRYSRSTAVGEETLTYHFFKGMIFEHKLEQGIIHIISEVKNAAVIQEGWRFFNGDDAIDFQSASFDVSNTVLDQVMSIPSQKDVLSRLLEAGIADSSANLLAEDMHNSKYRGSVLRVEYDEKNLPKSDKGLLILLGPKRMWLMKPRLSNGDAVLNLMPASQSAFNDEVAALLKEKADA